MLLAMRGVCNFETKARNAAALHAAALVVVNSEPGPPAQMDTGPGSSFSAAFPVIMISRDAGKCPLT